jgi:5-methylcytosine-specific restriction endonuclease McrA
MAWMKVETSVSRNRKFVKAGPGPSWLWVCGLAYCQEGLTDGFIPTEALPYLGVPRHNVHRCARVLVANGLWVVTDGGWRVVVPEPERTTRGSVRQFIARLRAFWGHACVYCGAAPRQLEVEHIVPIARGGTDLLSNLTLACQPCNRRKATKTAAEFGHPHIHRQAEGIQ